MSLVEDIILEYKRLFAMFPAPVALIVVAMLVRSMINAYLVY